MTIEQTTAERRHSSVIRWVVPAILSVLLSTTARAQTAGPDSSGGRPKLGDIPGDIFQAAEDTASDLIYIYTAPFRVTPKSLLILGGVLAVGGVLYANDQEIYDTLKRNEFEDGYRPIRDTGEFLEPIGFQGFTNRFLVAAMITGYLTGIEPLRQIPADILESFILTSVGKEAANRIFGRQGPGDRAGSQSFWVSSGRSLPSGHSVAITTVATVLAHHIRFTPFRVAVFAMAGTVLLQRITSDHHWASDVWLGSVFSFTVTTAMLKRKDNRRLEVTPTVTGNGAIGVSMNLPW